VLAAGDEVLRDALTIAVVGTIVIVADDSGCVFGMIEPDTSDAR
jgi:hypothetical protein